MRGLQKKKNRKRKRKTEIFVTSVTTYRSNSEPCGSAVEPITRNQSKQSKEKLK